MCSCRYHRAVRSAVSPLPANNGTTDKVLDGFVSVGATPAVVCTVPSGNFTPPPVPFVSITPATVSFEVGVSVPIPTNPNLSSKIIESPMNELLDVNPVHFVSLPSVPPPSTVRFGPSAVGVMLNKGPLAFTLLRAGIKLNASPFALLARASKLVN